VTDASVAQYGTPTPTPALGTGPPTPHPLPHTGYAVGTPLAAGLVLIVLGLALRARRHGAT
jgi:LPXTG-motif cell wall-anchored protein